MNALHTLTTLQEAVDWLRQRVTGTLQTECIGSAPFMAPEVVNQNYVRQQRIFARCLRSSLRCAVAHRTSAPTCGALVWCST